jgi:integrase
VPKPFLIHRRAGVYARFLVPADLRGRIGSRFLVRPLYSLPGEPSRVIAGFVGLVLSQAFERIRQGQDVADMNKVFDSAMAALNAGKAKRWEADIPLSDGRIMRMKTDGSDGDNSSAVEAIRAALGTTPAPSAPSSGPTLLAAAETYLADLDSAVRKGDLADKTYTESRHSLRILVGVVEDAGKPVEDVNADDIRVFFRAVEHWPKHADKRPEYKDMTVREIVAKSWAANEPQPAAFTIEKHRQRLCAFFNHLAAADTIRKNPVHGIAGLAQPDPEEESGRPWTAEDLTAIFAPEPWTKWAEKYPHRWFGTMLGLCSGARVAEVGQLEVSDIEEIEGVYGFSVRVSRTKGKRVKNKPSRRFVPIAKKVLKAGFLDYVAEAKAEGHTRLFPNLPNSTGRGFGRGLSRQFGVHLVAVGVHEEGSGFHYFRHTLASGLDGKVSERTLVAITGHKMTGGESSAILNDFYVKKTIADRKAAVDLFADALPETVVFPPYKKGQFRHALREAPKILEIKTSKKPRAGLAGEKK